MKRTITKSVIWALVLSPVFSMTVVCGMPLAQASVMTQPSLYDTYIPKTDLSAAPAVVTHVTDSTVYSTLTSANPHSGCALDSG